MNCEPLYTYVELFPPELNLLTGELRNMSEDDFKEYVEKLRHHFIKLHQAKHPIFAQNRTRKKLINDLNVFNDLDIDSVTLQTRKTSVRPLFDDPNESKNLPNPSLMLSYSTSQSNSINHWFPEIWDTIVTSSGKAVTTQLYNADDFYKNVHAIIIKDRLKLYDPNSLKGQRVDQYLKQCLRIVNGNQPVYNFPSTLAKWIYLNKAKRLPKDREDYYILDTSCGWGGRMLAAISSALDHSLNTKQVYYYGTDPNTVVHERFFMFEEWWRKNINETNNFHFYKATLPAEDIFQDEEISKLKDKFDIMMVSPPYFCKEQYSNDDKQSYKRYEENYPLWRDGFLKPMIKNTYDLLRVGGEAWINIADVKYKGGKYYPLEDDTILFAKKAGFKHVETYMMIFSVMPGLSKRSTVQDAVDEDQGIKKNKNKNTGKENPHTKNTLEFAGLKYKFEPIFKFVKE